jgi:hypothetical protein
VIACMLVRQGKDCRMSFVPVFLSHVRERFPVLYHEFASALWHRRGRARIGASSFDRDIARFARKPERRRAGALPWSCEMTESTLNAEQRRALAMLAAVDLEGTYAIIAERSRLRASLVVGLINRGLIVTMYETVRGSTTIDVTEVRMHHAVL